MPSTRKLGLYVAHDDDFILGTSGLAVQCKKQGGDAYVVVFTDGRHSHKAVLGIEKNPSPAQVAAKRKEEFLAAADIMGITRNKVYFLGLTDGDGRIWQNNGETRKRIAAITGREAPNLICWHYPDGHPDHRAVDNVMMDVRRRLTSVQEFYKFLLWTGAIKDIAKDHPELNADQTPEVPADAISVAISDEIKRLKLQAMAAMKSQVLAAPYPEWGQQQKPVLEKEFVKQVCGRDELFVQISHLKSPSFCH